MYPALDSLLPSPLFLPITVPPAPVTDLVNTTYEEELITITWTKGFDGFTPITGATIEYTPDGGSTTVRNVSSSGPTTETLSDLMPFIIYTISVSLFNIAGTGDAMVIQVQTRSRCKLRGFCIVA